MRTTPLFALSMIALGISSPVLAENHGHRQHDAHQHGLVEWHIAQDGSELLVEMTAPGSDIVGFEHAPENAEQKAAIKNAVISFSNPETLFAINADAKCKLGAQQVTQTLAEEEHSEHHGHDDHHDHDAHDEHNQHEDHKGHDHHDEHEGHDHDKKAQHGEFSVQYTFTCDLPAKLQSVTTDWFTTFNNTQKISVEAISDKGVQAAELTSSLNTFRF